MHIPLLFHLLFFPLDNDVGLPDTTSSFSIDNVHSHTAVFNPTDTGLENDQYSGIVPFSIVVNDSSEDNLSVLCYYKIPNETEWIYFHEFEDINPPSPTPIIFSDLNELILKSPNDPVFFELSMAPKPSLLSSSNFILY